MSLKHHLLSTNFLTQVPAAYASLWRGENSKVLSYQITICIPTYKRSKQLSKLLKAIYDVGILYSKHNFAILISINGPDEEYHDLEQKYKEHDAITFIRNDSGNTFPHNFSNLVSSCTTKYALFMGDDDWISPLYLMLLAKYVENNDVDSIIPITNFVEHTSLESYFMLNMSDILGTFDPQNLVEMQKIAIKVHSLYEPICGRLFNIEKLRNKNLLAKAYKQIFPQINYILNYSYDELFISAVGSDILCINAFEELDKTHSGAGILTLAKGLPERVLHRLIIILTWGLNAKDCHNWIDIILALKLHRALITEEFIRDCDSIVEAISDDFSQVEIFVTEMLIFPPIFLISDIYHLLYLKSSDFYTKLLFMSMALNAFILQFHIVELSDSSFSLGIVNAIKLQTENSQVHPLSTVLSKNDGASPLCFD